MLRAKADERDAYCEAGVGHVNDRRVVPDRAQVARMVDLLAQADNLAVKFQARGRKQGAIIRVGAIDSAAAGLLPMLLSDFREQRPDVTVRLTEGKTIRLLPALLSGRLDMALVRPPQKPDKRLEFLFLLHETAVLIRNEPTGKPNT